MMVLVLRLFVAVWPSPETIDRLAAIERPDERGVSWVPDRNWHVTLRFLGDAVASEVADLLEPLTLPRATARLGHRVERLDGRQIVVPVSGLDELAACVRDATADVGDPDRRDFRGHLTIARTKPHAHSVVLGTAFDASFEVGEIALVSSDLLPSGAVYTTLATFPTT
jgi:2'-5' RNA ligase